MIGVYWQQCLQIMPAWYLRAHTLYLGRRQIPGGLSGAVRLDKQWCFLGERYRLLKFKGLETAFLPVKSECFVLLASAQQLGISIAQNGSHQVTGVQLAAI